MFSYFFVLENRTAIVKCLKYWTVMQKYQTLPIVATANKCLLNYGQPDSINVLLDDLILVLLLKSDNEELFTQTMGYIIYTVKHNKPIAVVLKTLDFSKLLSNTVDILIFPEFHPNTTTSDL